MLQSKSIPVIDIGPLFSDLSSPAATEVAKELLSAFSSWGFIQITGHSVPLALQKDLLRCSKAFFELPAEKKLTIDVRTGGPAWRGYMPFGGESTHGKVDRKEGIYFGPEHGTDHKLMGMPLHGANQFVPDEDVPGMRETVLEYIKRIIEVGKALTKGISLALELGPEYMSGHLLQPEPVALFRCFKYAPVEKGEVQGSGIGEHTDFGYLTILGHDSPGLQMLSPSGEWTDVPVIEDALVVNVGDMLDMLTSGRFTSRKHRAISPSTQPRFSFPFFFDFSWDAKMEVLPVSESLPALTEEQKIEAEKRWAGTTFKKVEGFWWQYLAKKVKKVFPDLDLPDFDANSSVSTRFNTVVPVAPPKTETPVPAAA